MVWLVPRNVVGKPSDAPVEPAQTGWYRSTRLRACRPVCAATSAGVRRTRDPRGGRRPRDRRTDTRPFARDEARRSASWSAPPCCPSTASPGFAGGGRVGRLLGPRSASRTPGCRVAVEPELTVDLDLTVAYGLPVAEVARQVESAVRYTLRHALGREPDRVAIRIGRLRHEHGIAPLREVGRPAASRAPSDLAASGTDVA